MDEVFWFFFSKKNKRFFLKKEAKTLALIAFFVDKAPFR